MALVAFFWKEMERVGMWANRLFMKAMLGVVAVVGACSLASADTVTYSTVGSFTSNSTNTVSGGGITLSFLPLTNNVADTAPFGYTFASLGTFQISVTNPNTQFVINDSFTLTVNQSIPSPGGTDSFGIGTVSGTVKATSSSATVTFHTPLTINIPGTTADVSYTLINGTPIGGNEIYYLVPVSTNNGQTTVQAQITTTDHGPTVPTPASLIGGSVLLGMLYVGKTRGRRNAV